ncbi:ABC transporter ATP-binding protein [Rothia kristinae]|uniref:ABC transporter ATP-binding protein n=1 Tax=Rothia kristinae TaxID=37923 RepID=UPI0009C03AC4|nr:ATP-binding cassette domain-containing protein [Rothia kristinae]
MSTIEKIEKTLHPTAGHTPEHRAGGHRTDEDRAGHEGAARPGERVRPEGPHDAAPALALRGVSLEYPDGTDEHGRPRTLKALDSVDLSAERGRLCAVVGESGSGKSSLLSVAATLIAPTGGSVRIAGIETVGASEKERARLRREEIGVVFQQPNLIASLTALEQLLIAEHIRGLRGKRLRARRERAQELLNRVGLAGLGDRRLHQLSGGQRQRVNIARALMGSPSVLLADEPTSALDASRSREVVRLLAEITREFDVATLMVTHETELLDAADRVVTMSDGRLTEGV